MVLNGMETNQWGRQEVENKQCEDITIRIEKSKEYLKDNVKHIYKYYLQTLWMFHVSLRLCQYVELC